MRAATARQGFQFLLMLFSSSGVGRDASLFTFWVAVASAKSALGRMSGRPSAIKR